VEANLPKSVVLIVGAVVLVAAAALGFYLAIRFPQHHAVATVARWIGFACLPLLLVSLAIDRTKAK
jgi:hypothetical protein